MRDDDQLSRLRVPPHTLEGEQSVLGALMLEADAYDHVGDLLTESDFYSYTHRIVYRAIAAMIAAGKPADTITVFEYLQSHREDRRTSAGVVEVTLGELNAMTALSPGARNARRYAEIVHEKYLRRKLVAALDEASTIAWREGGESFEERMNAAMRKLDELSRGQQDADPVLLAKIAAQILDRISAADHTPQEVWKTRIPALDRMLNGGMRPGQVILIGGRPGMGKSALALWLLCLLAYRDNLDCLYLSQEMPTLEVGQRALSVLGQLSYSALLKGEMGEVDWSRLAEANDIAAKIPLVVDEESGLTLERIITKTRAAKPRVIVLDYVQLCEGIADDDSRNQQLERISRGLKKLAKDRNAVVIVLSQLNRKVDERSHGRAILSDYKDSGALEADADVVISLFHIKREKEAENYELRGIDVLKNRAGRTGTAVAEFRGDTMSWVGQEYDLAQLLGKKKAAGGEF